MKIIDVSQFQGHIDFKAISKKTLNADGTECKLVDAVYIRATQGDHWTDSKFKEYHDGFKSVGISIGTYHFFEFKSNPVQQAQYFINAISGREGDLIPMVDCEPESLVGPSDLGQRMQWLHTFNQYLLDHMKTSNLLIYTPLSFWNDKMGGTSAFQGHHLWIAEYNNDSAPEIPRGWNTWKIWQFTSRGRTPGITENTVDTNRFNGTSLSEIGR